MSVHCACWKDGEPCCWCLDNTLDEAAAHPPCTRTRSADCVADLEELVRLAEDALIKADDAKSAAVLAVAEREEPGNE